MWAAQNAFSQFYGPLFQEYRLTIESSTACRDDNAKIAFSHIAKTTQEWFKETKIKVLGWPSLNPDLIPIENKWEKFKVALHKRSPSNLWE